MNFDLFLEIHLFLKRRGMTADEFSRRALNDPKYLSEMKRGRTPKPATIAKIRAFMEAA